MSAAAEIFVSALIVIGAVFTLVGSWGLVKLDAPMSRLHAPTKAGTLGVGSVLMASMCYAFIWRDGSAHELLITAFLFVTAPVSAMLIAKVAIFRRTNVQELPPPPTDTTWATHDTGERAIKSSSASENRGGNTATPG
ncbi:Na+/H+ antiporter subunit G [Roseovarius amoyensis]|uniref:Na+/H+ antiporter subunit G n=1 Tax=Roseovarius amoyensis TaxID=2211448 RepID=UPI000DBE70B2|nr:Na+/H+ antiporter subunit G [Roseovarius amoyensis]